MIYCFTCGRRFNKLSKLKDHLWFEENELTKDEIELVKWLAKGSYFKLVD